MDKANLEKVVTQVLDEMRVRPLPVGVSSRHLHLCQADYACLFPNEPLSVKKNLLQPGQFAATQTVTLTGPKGSLERVRLLGPLRSKSQVEISRSDARILGIDAPLRLSGDIAGTPGIRLTSPYGEVMLAQGVIVAKRHIHMSPLDALVLGVVHGQSVNVAVQSDGRALVFGDVMIRVSEAMRLEFHIDTDEANAAGADLPGCEARLVRP
ncbi:phosphate propanoyltransferase [Mangrovibacter yixingensis]|uniref:phosphate propanoyltransferase n=1 Tax=Mangrovibacter yixingensis TaxID=1529639 RepID=UPI001CF97ED1|nr:phosphate propanoyltransferase [Mangrovibacter yixingensis]